MNSDVPDLEPAVDAYGSYARASAIADFLELWALNRQPKSRSDIADYIGDNGWASKLHETFAAPDDSDDADGEDEDLGTDLEIAVGRVFDQIEARNFFLRGEYPFYFDFDSGRLTPSGAATSPYLALLALTIAHAYRLNTASEKPHAVFEDTVARALNEAGHHSVNFSKMRSAFSNFGDAIKQAATSLSLRVAASEALASKWAWDEGTDVIAQIESGFSAMGGIGAWTAVGQATCAVSNEWDRKISEVKPPNWERWLDTQVPPQAFLAVPHQAEPRHIEKLVTGNQGVVLDRLRLAAMLRSVSLEETAILDEVRSLPLASL